MHFWTSPAQWVDATPALPEEQAQVRSDRKGMPTNHEAEIHQGKIIQFLLNSELLLWMNRAIIFQLVLLTYITIAIRKVG